VVNFIILTSWSLLVWCRQSLPIVDLKIFSLLTFKSKSPNINFIWYLGNPALVPHEKCLFVVSYFQNNDITPATSQNYIRHPIANKLCSLSWWYYSVVYKKILLPIDDIRFLFHKKLKSSARTVPTLSHISSCTLTKFNLYIANSLAAFVSELGLYRLLTVHVRSFISLFHCVSYWRISSGPRPFRMIRNIIYYAEEYLAPCPTKLEYHPLSAVHDCILNIFAATLHVGGLSVIRNLRTRHTVVTKTNYHGPNKP